MSDVAQTILSQLGGRRFIAMTGASLFVGGPNSLTFSVPRAKVNKIQITLDPSDTYTVTAYKKENDGLTYKEAGSRDFIYFDMLEDVFTELTGLYTRI